MLPNRINSRKCSYMFKSIVRVVYMHMRVYMYIHVCVYIYIYIYIYHSNSWRRCWRAKDSSMHLITTILHILILSNYICIHRNNTLYYCVLPIA